MNQERCDHLLNGMAQYLDGDASTELCAEIERHLARCADCRTMLDTLRKTVALCRSLPQPDFPAPARGRLYTALNLEDYLPRTR